MSKGLQHIRHDFIRYANCWEDADILAEALQVKHGHTVLSIGSAGDNSFMLLAHDPALLVAVDINEAQLMLIALKKAAIAQLDHPDLLCFLGIRGNEVKTIWIEEVLNKLDAKEKAYWSERKKWIVSVIHSAGKFERYFRIFRNYLLPCIHSKKTTQALLSIKSQSEQEHFYHAQWNTLRWRMLFRIFFSKAIMGKAGRDPAFLREVDIPVSTYIFEKAENHLSNTACQNNYMLRYILTGKYGETLPPYLRPENVELIRKNLDRLRLHHGYAEDAFQKYGSFDRFNLSDIFEYMNPSLFESTAKTISEHSNPGALFAYWNLMVERSLSSILPASFARLAEISEDLSAQDKGFFYQRFHVDTKIYNQA